MSNDNQLQIQPDQSVFSAESFEHAQRVALMLSKSSLIPASYQNNVQNTMIALEMAHRIGASPLMVMQHLYIVQGKPSFSSTFIIATINSCGKFGSSLRFEFSGEGDELSCVAWCIEKGSTQRIESPRATVKMAKEQGWWAKNGSKWPSMTELMLSYRAAAFFGRLYAPEITMGMQTYDEVLDTVEDSSAKIEKTKSRKQLLKQGKIDMP